MIRSIQLFFMTLAAVRAVNLRSRSFNNLTALLEENRTDYAPAPHPRLGLTWRPCTFWGLRYYRGSFCVGVVVTKGTYRDPLLSPTPHFEQPRRHYRFMATSTRYGTNPQTACGLDSAALATGRRNHIFFVCTYIYIYISLSLSSYLEYV